MEFFFVTPEDAALGDAWPDEPGWWFQAAHANPRCVNYEPIGRYDTLKEARDDVRLGEENA